MIKTLHKFWNTYCQPAMQRISGEEADSQALIALAKSITADYSRRRQQKFTADAELGSKFQRIFDNSLVAMSFYDKDGYLINLNDKMRDICAFDAIGEDFFRKTCLFDTPSFHGDYAVGSTEPFYVCQHMRIPELGIDRYIEVQIRPTLDNRHQLQYYVITTRDITKERLIYLEQSQRAEEQQRLGAIVGDYEQKLNYLLRSSNMYVWWLDLKTRRISFTRSLKKEEFSESLDEYVESVFEDERAATVEHMKQLLVEPHTFNFKRHFLHTPTNPNPQWLYINGQSVLDEEGKVIALFGILRDVTAIMETQSELHKETKRAEESGYMKSAYLANMSHEIRTPLNAIVGFSDLLHVVDDDTERKEFIRIVQNNCDILLRLINDIIEASDMGQALNIEPADIDFARVFDDICQTIAQHVDAAGVEFIKDNPYDTFPTTLDKGRIQQVITNFVSNAVKFTNEGHIKVGYKASPAPSEGGETQTSNLKSQSSNPKSQTSNLKSQTSNLKSQCGLYIYCEDTGAGIPKEKQASVFDRFVKLHDHVQGTGLGLSICKNIVERCGGTIGVNSEGPGCGSTFWCWIPCERKNQSQ